MPNGIWAVVDVEAIHWASILSGIGTERAVNDDIGWWINKAPVGGRRR